MTPKWVLIGHLPVVRYPEIESEQIWAVAASRLPLLW
jgi:hypothetical protein